MKSKGHKRSFLDTVKPVKKKKTDENSNKINQKKTYVFENAIKNPNLQIFSNQKSFLDSKVSSKKKKQVKRKMSDKKKSENIFKKYLKPKKHKKSELQTSLMNLMSQVKGEEPKQKVFISNKPKSFNNHQRSKTISHNFILENDKILETILSIQDLENSENDVNSSDSSNQEDKEGALIRFDSSSQSVSIISMKSLYKNKKSKENSVKADSIIMNNLSICQDSNKNLFSPNTFFEKKFKAKNKLKANFLSQVDNRIIEEDSFEKEKKNQFFDFKDSVKDLNFPDNIFPEKNSLKKMFNHKKKKSENLSSNFKFLFKNNSNIISKSQNINESFLKSDSLVLSIESKKKIKLFFEEFLRKTTKKIEYCFNELRELQDLKKISNPKDSRTKLMIKNIPNKFTVIQLVDLFQKEFPGKFDFVYLVMDSQTDCNQGYGFINICKAEYKSDFIRKYHRTKWPGSKSGKVCEISYAKLQTPERIDNKFLEKYFREWNKYWVDPKIIIKKFPNLEREVYHLENMRRNPNYHSNFMNYNAFFENNMYPFGY